MSDRRVLLITGASSGIGAATARRAAEAGFRLVLGARREEPLRDLVRELGVGEVLAVRSDVADWADVERLTAAGLERFERIDAVFANAGGGVQRGFLEGSVEEWREMVLTNVLGVALTIRATLPHMLERGTGHFVITSSLAGRRVVPGSLYSATKFAATALGEGLRAELRQVRKNRGIRVTVVEPGAVDTPFFDQQLPFRPLDANDVARTVLYALEQPEHVDLAEVVIRPTAQPF